MRFFKVVFPLSVGTKGVCSELWLLFWGKKGQNERFLLTGTEWKRPGSRKTRQKCVFLGFDYFFFSPTISTLFGQAAASAALIKALIHPGLTKPNPAVSAFGRVLAIVLCSKQAQKARISPQNSTLRAFSAFLLLASSPFLKICA